MQDLKVEHWLAAHKLKYTYTDKLALETVVVDAQAKENIRLTDELEEDLVVRYGVALENGADFPGIVVYKDGKGKHGLISGWHRTEAYRLAERKVIPAYVVELDHSDGLLISVLRRTANTLEGKTLSMAEAIQHGYYLVGQGYKITDAARLLNLPIKRLEAYVAANKTRLRLAKMEGTEGISLSTSQLTFMRSLPDAQLREVALLAHEARLTMEMTVELTHQVKEADQWRDVIEAWRHRLASELARSKSGGVRPPGSNIRRLPTSLAQIERLVVKSADDAASLRAHEIEALLSDIRRTIATLQELLKHLEKVRAHAQGSAKR
jgi:hypothetical protein